MKFKNFLYFYPECPILITKEQDLFWRLSNDPSYIAEKKYNGQRLELHVWDTERFEFWNRHGAQLSFEPDERLRERIRYYLGNSGYCIFDGELRHNKTKGIQQKIVLYDIFMLDGELLTSKPFWFRRGQLSKMVSVEADPLGITMQFQDRFDQMFETVIKNPEIEGLVIKNLNGNLNLSRTGNQKSSWMYKVRRPNGSYDF